MTAEILLLILGAFALQALVLAVVLVWLRQRMRTIASDLRLRCSQSGHEIVLGPASASYRGADFTYGQVRGNGILCVTDRAIIFARVVGKRIEIPLAEVLDVTEARSFKGKLSLGSGATHLVFHTKDHKRIAFLLRDAAEWRERLISGLLVR